MRAHTASVMEKAQHSSLYAEHGTSPAAYIDAVNYKSVQGRCLHACRDVEGQATLLSCLQAWQVRVLQVLHASYLMQGRLALRTGRHPLCG